MDVTSNPWIVNAADVVAGPVTVWLGKCLIVNIELQHYVASTDFAIVNQSNGKLFAYLTGAADLELVRTGDTRHADGIVIPIGGITNGTLRIYHR